MNYTKDSIRYPVEVLWIDSVRSYGWHHEIPASALGCRTVGLLLKSGKDRVAVLQNEGPYGIGDVMEIPAEAVRKVRRLK